MKRLTSALVLCVLVITTSNCSGQEELEQRRDAYKNLSSLETRVRQLEDALTETRDLTQQLKLAADSSRELASRISELRSETQLLTDLQIELHKWSTATMVLGNENTGKAMAIQMKDGVPEVTATARHPFLKYAIKAARAARINRYASPPIQKIVSEYFRQPSEYLPAPLVGESATAVAELSRSAMTFSRDASFMVYRDPVADTQRVAFVNSSTDSRQVITLAKEADPFASKALVGGSGFIGGPEDIEHHLEVGQPFLDYCALSVLHALFREDNQRESPAVALAVILGGELQKQIPVERTSYFDRYVTAGENRTRNSDDLKSFGQAMANELQSRLSRRDVYVVERELAELVAYENSLGTGDFDLSAQLPADATHLLALKIDANPSGRNRMALRLIDRITQETIWAATDENTVVPSRTWENYLVQSGVPHIIQFDSDSAAREFSGNQSVRKSDKFVAVVELQDNQQTIIRQLFAAETMAVETGSILAFPVTTDGTKVSDEFLVGRLSQDLLPYLSYRFGRQLLAPASRLTNVTREQTGYSAILGVGSHHELAPGDRFRLRDLSKNRNLPSVGALVDILDSGNSRLFIPTLNKGESQHETIMAICDTWEERRVSVFMPSLDVTDPQLSDPQHHDKLLRLKQTSEAIRPTLQRKFYQALDAKGVAADTGQFEWALDPGTVSSHGTAVALREARFLDRLDFDAMATQAKKKGATHVIGGQIRRVKIRSWEVSYALHELQTDARGKTTLGKSLDSVTFPLSESDWVND